MRFIILPLLIRVMDADGDVFVMQQFLVGCVKMNYENIRIKYIDYGPIIFLTGILVYVMSLIVDFLTQTLLDVSYPIIIFSTFIGMLFIMFGVLSFLFIGCGKG